MVFVTFRFAFFRRSILRVRKLPFYAPGSITPREKHSEVLSRDESQINIYYTDRLNKHIKTLRDCPINNEFTSGSLEAPL